MCFKKGPLGEVISSHNANSVSGERVRESFFFGKGRKRYFWRWIDEIYVANERKLKAFTREIAVGEILESSSSEWRWKWRKKWNAEKDESECV